MRTRVSFAALLLAAPVLAQNLAYSPAGSRTIEGSNNNTIPLWSDSATYMQIHDYQNMVGALSGQPTTLLGLTLRKDSSNASINGRTLTLQMTVAETTVDSYSATNSFAGNLGPGATIVLPYGPVSFPTLTQTSVPNPPGIVVLWNTPFPFQLTAGASLCWEWRHHSSTDRSNGSMDAVSTNSASAAANEGVGCLVTGQTRASTIDSRSLNLTTQIYRNRLNYGSANAGAVFVLGGQRTTLQLPGQCAPLLTNPLVFVPGSTDTVGQWDLSIPTPDLRRNGRAELLGQFVWLDANLPIGLGVSDMSVVATPLRGAYFMSRFYASPSGGGAGFENATNASGSSIGYGLVVGFMTP